MVTSQTAEIVAEMTLTELRCTVRALKMDLNLVRNLKGSFENSLREVEVYYAMQVEQLNRIQLHGESDGQIRAEGLH